MQINELIEILIKNTNLGNLIKEPVRVYGGLLNRMYKVNTIEGIYAIKHLNSEVMKRKDAKENGIECLPAKVINNTVLQKVNNNYFLIYDWFEGKPISDTEITFEHIEKIARILAKIHNLDFGEIKGKCSLGRDITEVDWDFYISKLENESIKKLLIDRKDELTILDKKATKNAIELRNNLVVSHRDLDLPNVLWHGNNPVLIDWESAGLVNPCEEVLETAWDWSGGQEYFDIKKFEFFLETYKKNNGDLKDFEKAIYSNFKNKSGWLEYNLKRVCKIECIDEEEQKLGEIEVVRVINEIIYFYKVLKNFII